MPAGEGFRSHGTLCAGCAQICIYSNFAVACSYIQILNQATSLQGIKPLTTNNLNKNTPKRGIFI